ncbi:MAG: hypothetical protein MJB57_08840 [Gemmatimonadetes bacterium]|nr:hypothetical protein [Gemmatimonadota bacterium]
MMKRFLEIALLADPPLVTVASLGKLARRSAQDVWYHWRGEAHYGTPKELLQWIVLVRAVLGRPRGATWEKVAKSVNASGQRLRRTVRSLLETTLEEAVMYDGLLVERSFDRYLATCFGLSSTVTVPSPALFRTA